MEYRVILIGKTGNGKSSTGNSITESSAFKSDIASVSVTLKCEVHNKKRKDGRVFMVCDTPGLFCAGEDPIEIALRVQQSVKICPNPHVFLLVFTAACRMTTDEKYTIDLLRVIFGDTIFDHCIVVITRGNDLKSQDKFDRYLTENVEMKKILKKCGNRVVKIENDTDCPNKSDLGGLLKEIEKLANKGSYNYSFLNTHAEVLQEYKHTYGVSNSANMDTHLHKILGTLGKKLDEEKKKMEEEKKKEKVKNIATGVLIGAGIAGASGLSCLVAGGFSVGGAASVIGGSVSGASVLTAGVAGFVRQNYKWDWTCETGTLTN